MAKIIKRAGIVFLVLVISLLLILGCMLAVNTATEDKNAELQNNDGNIQETAEKSYTLSGTCSQMATTWNEAVTYSKNNSSAPVDVILGGDWTAQSDSDYTTAFGTGTGFSSGKLYIGKEVNITLDLNGYTMNRNLTETIRESGVFVVNGIFTLKDSYYTKEKAQTLDSVEKIENTRIGKITGCNSSDDPVLLVEFGNAECNVYGGVFYNNLLVYNASFTRGNIISGNFSIVNIYGGLIAFNKNQIKDALNNVHSGMVSFFEGSALTLRDVIIRDNIGTQYYGVTANALRAHSTQIGAGVQIYNNMDESGNNQYNFYDTNAKIIEPLDKDGKTTYIGINKNGYGTTKTFIADYSKYNSITPQKYFFLDKDNNNDGYIIALNNGELSYDTKLTSDKYDFVYFEDGYRKNYKDNNIEHGLELKLLENCGGTYAVLGNIMPNTSINTLISAINFDGSKVAIYDNKGELVFNKGTAASGVDTNNNIINAVGTGWRLETYSRNNEIIETVYLSVFGDVNGDGRITASDVAYLRQLASDADLFTSLDMHKQVAASIINKGKLTKFDADILRLVIDKVISLDFYI